jgi:tetratricopeptide (TPR) repeat protein
MMNAADWANKLYNDKEYKKCTDMAYPQQKDPDVLFYAALALDKLEKHQEFVAMLRRTLFHKSDHEGAMRAFAWSDAGDVERLAMLEKMARKNMCDADDYCLMGQLYNQCNRLNEAHHWFQMALEKEPRNALGLLGVAEVHVKLAVRYLQDAQNEQDLDLTQQMSDEWDAEEVMRFIFDNITKKMPEPDLEELEELHLPQA